MKSQTQRILTLDRWLRSQRRLSAKAAAAELGVDERTIRRDLKQVLAGEWRLPVRYDRSARVWYYDGEVQTLPATIVSTADRLALLLSLQSVEQYRGTPIYNKLKDLYQRLLELLMPETRTSYESLAAKVRFEGPLLSPISTDVWTTLTNALEANETVRMLYHTGRSGETRRRSVDPYGLVVRHREWYLVGWDHFRRAVRTFFLPRIESIEYTDRRFKIRNGFDLDRYLATAVDGQQSSGPVHHVKLRFSKAVEPLAEEYVWNATQKISRDRHGRVIVVFDTGALYAVERQVSAWGGMVEVLEPRTLRIAVFSKATALMFAHKTSRC